MILNSVQCNALVTVTLSVSRLDPTVCLSLVQWWPGLRCVPIRCDRGTNADVLAKKQNKKHQVVWQKSWTKLNRRSITATANAMVGNQIRYRPCSWWITNMNAVLIVMLTDKLASTVRIFQRCEVLSHSLINHCAVFWHPLLTLEPDQHIGQKC